MSCGLGTTISHKGSCFTSRGVRQLAEAWQDCRRFPNHRGGVLFRFLQRAKEAAAAPTPPTARVANPLCKLINRAPSCIYFLFLFGLSYKLAIRISPSVKSGTAGHHFFIPQPIFNSQGAIHASIDPDNEQFVIYVRSKKGFKAWYPLNVVTGGSTANTLVKSLDSSLSL